MDVSHFIFSASKCDETMFFFFEGHMLHKDLMVGHNPHFETKNTYLKSIKGIGGGTQRYVACSLTEDQ